MLMTAMETTTRPTRISAFTWKLLFLGRADSNRPGTPAPGIGAAGRRKEGCWTSETIVPAADTKSSIFFICFFAYPFNPFMDIVLRRPLR